MTTRPVALITGASSGIGLELARQCAADGHDLIIAARRTERLHALAQELQSTFGAQVHVLQSDLTQPNAAAELWQRASAISPCIDVLINNAGVGDSGNFAQEDPATLERMMTLNMTALTLLMRFALPGMLVRRRGKVMNVASLVAFQPGGPGMAVYYASKSYVLSFSRAVRRELKGCGVNVTVLCPGATATEFEATANAQQTRLFHWTQPMSAGEVARQGYRGMQHGCAVVVPGWKNKLLAMSWMVPDWLSLEINRYLLSSRH